VIFFTQQFNFFVGMVKCQFLYFELTIFRHLCAVLLNFLHFGAGNLRIVFLYLFGSHGFVVEGAIMLVAVDVLGTEVLAAPARKI
jgi:hypothetical protein